VIENLRLNSQVGAVSGSARIAKTGDRDGGREKRRFEEELVREELEQEELVSRDETAETLEEPSEEHRGRVVDIRV
jgi:hypothetical protein